MARQCQLTLRMRVDATETNTAAGVGAAPARLRHLLELAADYANGTGDDQGDVLWSDDGSVTAGVPDDLDVSGGLTSKLSGAAATFAELTVIAVKHTGGAGNLVIGGGSNPVSTIWGTAGDQSVIGPGGIWVWASPTNGAAVTAATADILRIASSSGTVTYDIVIHGRSA